MSRRRRVLEDLEQDIRNHIEIETQDNIERGMPAEQFLGGHGKRDRCRDTAGAAHPAGRF